MKRSILAAAFVLAFTFGGHSALRAAVTTSGATSFQTGTPTPTLQITAPITLKITTTGSVNILAFDEWITPANSYRQSLQPTPRGQTVAFTLDGAAGTTPILILSEDNYVGGSITAKDGYLYFSNPIAVTVGQTLIFRPGSFVFGSDPGSDANLPTSFTGNGYVTDSDGNALSDLAPVGNVPERSTWIAAVLGAGLLGLVTSRRRTPRA